MCQHHQPLFSDQASLYPDARDVIAAIHDHGGLSFLAHPFVYSSRVVDALDSIVGLGLDGAECHYGTFTAEQKRFMTDYCARKGIFGSGGSDHHGLDMRPRNIMGYAGGERITCELVTPWLSMLEDKLI